MSTSEILEQGPRRPLPRWIIGVGVLLALGVGLFGWRALVDEASAPRELSVVAVSVAEITSIDPNAAGSGWPIKVGMPADGRIPAATLTVTINGDARRDVEIVPASSGGALSIEPTKPRVIAAGTTTDIAVTIAPLDCAVNSTTLDEAGYRWRRAAGVNLVDEIAGATLPLTETAREQLADILLGLCSAAPQPPTISMLDARLDGPWRQQVLDITVALGPSTGPVLLHPLDGPGLRGIGTFARPDDTDVTLMWAVAPLSEDTDGVLDALVRIITVSDGLAYPWIVRISPPADLAVTPRSATLTPLRTSP